MFLEEVVGYCLSVTLRVFVAINEYCCCLCFICVRTAKPRLHQTTTEVTRFQLDRHCVYIDSIVRPKVASCKRGLRMEEK